MCLYKKVDKKQLNPTSVQRIEKMEMKIVRMSWMSWSIVRFNEIIFQIDTESFSFLSFLKKFSLGRSL